MSSKLMPLLPIEPSISKKLYILNATYIGKIEKNTFSRKPWFENIEAKFAKLNKFTIVELTYHGHHYHGLASKADCDNSSVYTGLAVAYNRAFKLMCGVNK